MSQVKLHDRFLLHFWPMLKIQPGQDKSPQNGTLLNVAKPASKYKQIVHPRISAIHKTRPRTKHDGGIRRQNLPLSSCYLRKAGYTCFSCVQDFGHCDKVWMTGCRCYIEEFMMLPTDRPVI
jgi:hypothetical protein